MQPNLTNIADRPGRKANLTLIADRLRKKAGELEQAPAIGGDYEQGEFILPPTELSAPIFLRERAARYDEAQCEMDKWKPYVHAQHLLILGPPRWLLVTFGHLAGIGMGLLAYVVMVAIL